MDLDQFCKFLTQKKAKNLGVSVDKLYSAQFEYQDMVNRLNKVKREKEKKDMLSCYSIRFNKMRSRKNLSCDRKKVSGDLKIQDSTQKIKILRNSLPKIKSGQILAKDNGNFDKMKLRLNKHRLVSVYNKLKISDG
jgi:hypothetical protein